MQLGQSIVLPKGSTIHVTLESWIDARKNKVGDQVVAKTKEDVKSAGQAVMPRGTKVVGHLTAVKGKTREESESVVGIIFDHALLKDGSQVPLRLTLQAIAPDESTTANSTDLPTMANDPNRGAPSFPGAVTDTGPHTDPNFGTPGRPASPANPAYAQGELSTAGELTPTCHGVLGINGLTLSPETEDSSQGSLIVSRRRNVHLDRRTQMMLRVTGD